MSDTVPKIPTVAIVGRPNVGKSSLFNAVLRRRQAIVHEESGVTRDRIAAPAKWKDRHFQIIDTGGLGMYGGQKKNLGIWDSEIKDQVEIAIDSAEILVMVVDVTAGPTSLDMDIANKLRASGKKVFLAVNKSDNENLDGESANFAGLGFERVFPVSCVHRRGVEALLDKVIESIDWENAAPLVEPGIRIAVVGRPNVGKSSIVNRLVGHKRVMVSNIPGTTRDSVEVSFELECKDGKVPAVLVDTAGLRQKRKADTAVEIFSIMRAEETVSKAQLVLFVVEASIDGVTAQDKKIADMIQRSGKGCIILANKWDLCRKAVKREDVQDEIRYCMPFMDYAPIVFISALDGSNFNKITSAMGEIRENMRMHIPTSLINKILGDATARNAPSAIGTVHHHFKIYYATMVGNEPPRFLLFVNDPGVCTKNYLSYISNCLRKSLGLTGLPIRISLRAREKTIAPRRSFKKSKGVDRA
ncbi:MAG TPA: ribosome biogenesis GTPase Der [Lentisphaeria bacterium]|nr:MAG: ribosome biogenesis GTPase Der [Lentisphaerae bacterium GWF2_49_21]HBC86848.1 ribosome biogenesis GTPase Der [Lentisphaeria bacterium]